METARSIVNQAPQYWGQGMLAGLAALGLIYRDRAAFDEKRPGIAQEPGWPVLGNIPDILKWVPYFHEFGHEVFTRMDQLTAYVKLIFNV